MFETDSGYRDLFENNSSSILVLDPKTARIIEANPAAAAFYGCAREELIGAPLEHLDTRSKGEMIGWLNGLAEKKEARSTLLHRAADGAVKIVEMRTGPIEVCGELVLFCLVEEAEDTDRVVGGARHPAHYDSLTDIPNRALFAERLSQSIARANRDSGLFAVHFLDLDHFKDVNDALGHRAGDALLRAFAERLTGFLRETDTVARFGGDEFAVLQADLRDPTHAATLAQKVLNSLALPFTIDGRDIHTSASIGIVVHAGSIEGPEDMMNRAENALHQAKEEGRNTFRFQTDALDLVARKQVTLSPQLHHALEREEFELHYQPQVDPESDRIVGLEALVRWHHPERGLIYPDEFIGVAEDSGLILPLGEWILDEACRQAHLWFDQGILPGVMAVNLSPLQFKEQSLVEQVLATLSRSGLPAERLELELTESTVMESMRGYHAILGRLSGHGIKLSIDDFGTGYSSLKYLRTFPVYKLKIAQEFIVGLPTDANDVAIVKATIDLAKDLGLKVIAEGVETTQQLDYLRSLDCNQIQGFHYSRPRPAEEIGRLLSEGDNKVKPPETP